jgi:hypothetical protein
MMRWHDARMTIRRSMAVVALLALLFALVVPPLRYIDKRNKQAEYERVAYSLLRAITSLEERVPQDLSPQVWVRAVRETTLCQFNICFGTGRTSIEELKRLRDDLTPKLSGQVDVGTLDWIWERFTQTNADGARFVGILKPKFEACFPRKALANTL